MTSSDALGAKVCAVLEAQAAAIASAAPPASEHDFKARFLPDLPHTRVKRVMKAERGVRMLSTEATYIATKACELFIAEVATRAWAHAEMRKDQREQRTGGIISAGVNARTLLREDVTAAADLTPHLDFLVPILTPGAMPSYLVAAGVVAEGSALEGGTEAGSGVEAPAALGRPGRGVSAAGSPRRGRAAAASASDDASVEDGDL